MPRLLPVYDSYVMLTGIWGVLNVRLRNEGLTASFFGFYSHSSECGRGRSRASICYQASNPPHRWEAALNLLPGILLLKSRLEAIPRPSAQGRIGVLDL